MCLPSLSPSEWLPLYFSPLILYYLQLHNINRQDEPLHFLIKLKKNPIVYALKRVFQSLNEGEVQLLQEERLG